jgi:hypothetical protein
MARRRVFHHDGKACHVIAEMSTCNAKSLDLLLSTLGSLVSVPIECREKDMRWSGISPGRDYYIDLKLAPNSGVTNTQTSYVDTRVSAEENEPKKRKRSSSPASSPPPPQPLEEVYKADIDDDDDDDDNDVGESTPESECAVGTMTDYYRRYDTHDVTVQVDIDCLLHMTGVAKRSDTLSITIYSFSETGEAERILITAWDRNTTTTGTVTPQYQTCDVWALPSFKAVSMVIMHADSLSDHIKSVASASQSACVTIGMTGNQENKSANAPPQVLSLTAVGDIGPVSRLIRSNVLSHVKFVNDRKNLLPTDSINFSGRYSCKPLVQIGRIAPICKFVRMYLSPDQPLKLHYTIPDLGDLFFFLSPREEDDESAAAAAAATGETSTSTTTTSK